MFVQWLFSMRGGGGMLDGHCGVKHDTMLTGYLVIQLLAYMYGFIILVSQSSTLYRLVFLGDTNILDISGAKPQKFKRTVIPMNPICFTSIFVIF